MKPIESSGGSEPDPGAVVSGPRRTWRRRLIQITAFVFVGLFIVLFTIQRKMIFPGTETQGTEASKIHPRRGASLVTLRSSGGIPIAAHFGPALTPDGKPLPDVDGRAALIYFYGNAMCAAYCDDEFERFRRLGLDVVIPDYPGYGMSGGDASELGCREAADACLGYLRSRGIPENRIIAAGWSLGGAVAIDLASRSDLGGLIAFSTFTSATDMARTIIPLPLPGFFLRDQFESLAKISKVRCPILLGHGRRDTLVPFSMFERLCDATSSPPSKIVIDDAGHNDFYDRGCPTIFKAIADFVGGLDKPSQE